MNILVFNIVLTLFFIICSAFFSGAETALFSLSRARLLDYAGQSRPCRRYIVGLMNNYNRTLTAIVLGNMFMNASIAITVNGIVGRFSDNPVFSLVLSLSISLVILLIGGEVTPKAVAILNAELVSDFVAPILWYYRKLVMPLVLVLEKIHSLLWKLLGRTSQPPLTHDEYYAFVDMASDADAFSEEEARTLKEVLDLNELRVSRLIRSRMDIKCVFEDMSADEIEKGIRLSHQKFLPVAKKSIDDAELILSTRDFFRLAKDRRARWKEMNCCFEAVFIPDNATIQKVLSIFIMRKIPSALAVDEFGGVTGIICKKDIYGRVFGDIVEEFEKSDWQIKKTGDSTWILNGNIMVDDLAEFIPSIRLPESENSTLSGMIVEILSDFPKQGETLRLGNCLVSVSKINRNRITEFEINIEEKEAEDEEI